MQDKQNQEPKNERGEPHGQWMCYYEDGTLWFMDNNINGDVYGYGVYQECDNEGNDYYVKVYYAR